MPSPLKPESHEAYLAAAAPEVRERLARIRGIVQAAVPDAVPCISYGMPAFRRGRVFFYFAAFRRHIGIYPPVKGPPALVQRLADHLGPKGNLSFPLNQSLPLALIEEVARALAAQYTSAADDRAG